MALKIILQNKKEFFFNTHTPTPSPEREGEQNQEKAANKNQILS